MSTSAAYAPLKRARIETLARGGNLVLGSGLAELARCDAAYERGRKLRGAVLDLP